MADRYNAGLTLDAETVDRLDELAERWDDERAETISRSRMARETLPLGLLALDLIDEHIERNLTLRDREAIVRQALLDNLRDDDS